MTSEHTDGSGKGLLSRVTARLARTESEIEAKDLQEDTWRLGGTPIINLVDRSEARVCGAVRSVTLRPRTNVPALVVEIYDGSKALNLIWLGRRRIGGVCLLYTSDAADEEDSVDLGGRRIIKKK